MSTLGAAGPAPDGTSAPGAAAGEAASRFRALFGREPEGVWSAPGRVNLIGEFTDYNEGFVLPIALPLAARVLAAHRDDGRLRVASTASGLLGGDAASAAAGSAPAREHAVVEARLDSLAPGSVGGWPAYVLGVAWALREAGHEVGGADLLVSSDVPIGAGLSSSAALECAVGLALDGLFRIGVGRQELALACQTAENDFVGVPCGILDQMASLLCVPDHALLLDTRSLKSRQVPFALQASGLALLVVDTRVRHDHAASGYADRRRACERAAEALGLVALRDLDVAELDSAERRLDDPVLFRRVRHVVTENRRVLEVARLLEQGRTAEIGPVLSAGHASVRDDFEASCAELDTAVAAATAAGALGARMIGGGFGGSAIALVESGRTDQVASAVLGAFAAAGYAAPRVILAAPGPGGDLDLTGEPSSR